MSQYDVLVVGAGSTGGALAGRLAAHSDKSVLVLEGGPIYSRPDQLPAELIPPGLIAAAAPGHPNNWPFMAEFTPNLKSVYPRGKGLGGSSSINGCYFIRGTKVNFDEWAAAGNADWSYERVLPYFKRLESDRDFDGDLHGTDGPVPIMREPLDRAREVTSAFDEAFLNLGFSEEPDKNAEGKGGFGPVPLNIDGGRRMSTAICYLLPNMHRPNLHVIGDAVVTRVLFEGSTAVGVEAVVDGSPRQYFANEVVISSGALRSPQLLMLSGIGPADHLRNHGVEVLVDLPGVGMNLTDHPMISASYDVEVAMPKMVDRGPITTALHWDIDGRDVEILPFVCKAGDMLNAGDVLARPLKAVAAMRGTSARAVTRQARQMRHSMLGLVLLQERSRGSVTLSSADPADVPVTRWNLLSEPADRKILREVASVAYEVFQSAPMRAIGAELVGLSKKDLKDDKALDAFVEGRITAGHPSCTCRMGPDSDPTAVVDQQLRVKGVTNLRVADTSVFPLIPSRGPNATAYMVGERLADLLS